MPLENITEIKLNIFEIKQVKLLAEYYPFSFLEIKEYYIKLDKSFDKTKKVIQLIFSNNVSFEEAKMLIEDV
ncbi:MAG TPA: hypothetical protein PKK80_02940 [Bacilli bacterium]|nr:hypothetical protein [Bacilli bacterium]